MIPSLNSIGKALRMDSERAVKYLGSGAKNAQKINAKALQSAGAAGAHNAAIRSRQMQLGRRAGIGMGIGGAGMMGLRRKPEPMNPQPTAKGSGRYV